MTIQFSLVKSLNLFKSSEIFQGSLLFIPMILFLERAQIRFIDIKLILELKWQDDFRNLKFQSLHKQSLQDYLWRSLF